MSQGTEGPVSDLQRLGPQEQGRVLSELPGGESAETPVCEV